MVSLLTVLSAIADQSYNKEGSVYIFDIYVTKDGKEVQPDGKARNNLNKHMAVGWNMLTALTIHKYQKPIHSKHKTRYSIKLNRGKGDAKGYLH